MKCDVWGGALGSAAADVQRLLKASVHLVITGGVLGLVAIRFELIINFQVTCVVICKLRPMSFNIRVLFHKALT